MDYQLPQRDITFLLDEVLDLDKTLALPGYEHCDKDTFFAVVDAINGFVRDNLATCNEAGDSPGARLEDGQVYAAPGFGDAYKVFCEDGWNALALEEEFGGQQLPFVLHAALREGMAGTNLAFALIHELNFGVVEALMAYGSEEQKAVYCPQLTSGNWAGTMNLTEPHCGTDLGLIRTKALRNDDGSYAITGNKIFITWGDHDMSENVAHLILARVEGAQPGPRGLSLFLAPKYMLDVDNNTTDQRNTITIAGIENKMGIHGSPTCAISFEDTKAWIVGEEGKGLAAMFVMMNAARLSVGLQGLGVAEAAVQTATAYAHERLQGRADGEPLNPNGPADPLIAHADVRRRLLTAQGEMDAARALAYFGASLLDAAHRAETPELRKEADTRLSLLTPVIKSYLSDMGSRMANEAVQMHGGHGFIKDYGVEQLVRDVRITEIYEGTNAVQARDLVMRKVRGDNGAVIKGLIADMLDEAGKLGPDLSDVETHLRDAATRLGRSTDWVLGAAQGDVLSGACDYLEIVALSLSAWMSARIARVATVASGDQSPDYYADRADAARAFMARALPRAVSHELIMQAGEPGIVCRADRCL
ncbi:acyl-CoA dehydrogenase family protein [Ruegeria sp. Ofav3-42]|uniref:acyl-CoA dehydrogenase family protein n=1 Tax=Ruegeria sp. Ofav3-42 TaxID=2917759 RepID=UPI001EF58147|nr:acyl-CoA dehydrogenase family protein [Ruegeria sp. Ofav3-42]MCG7519908.1 acyl-CoA dehydrogenase C-terminal domain-containing protein [Ruegeria sp. Ofav3-42]